MTICAEESINRVIQSCKRARSHHLEMKGETPTARPVFCRDEEEDTLVESPLNQQISHHGVTVQVQIYGDGEGKWILELVDRQNTSHVWDDRFETDAGAFAEAVRALEEHPMEFAGEPTDAGDLH